MLFGQYACTKYLFYFFYIIRMKRWEKYQGQRKYLKNKKKLEKISKWKNNHKNVYQQEQSIWVLLSSEQITQKNFVRVHRLFGFWNLLTMFPVYRAVHSTFSDDPLSVCIAIQPDLPRKATSNIFFVFGQYDYFKYLSRYKTITTCYFAEIHKLLIIF